MTWMHMGYTHHNLVIHAWSFVHPIIPWSCSSQSVIVQFSNCITKLIQLKVHLNRICWQHTPEYVFTLRKLLTITYFNARSSMISQPSSSSETKKNWIYCMVTSNSLRLHYFSLGRGAASSLTTTTNDKNHLVLKNLEGKLRHWLKRGWHVGRIKKESIIRQFSNSK